MRRAEGAQHRGRRRRIRRVDVVEIGEEEVRRALPGVACHLFEHRRERLAIGRHHRAGEGGEELPILALQGVEEAGGLEMAPEARLGERQEQREGVQRTRCREHLPVVAEAARHARHRSVEDEIPRHDLGVKAGRRQQLGQRRRGLPIRHRLEMRAVLGRQEPREHAAVGRERPALRRVGAPKRHRLLGETGEKRRARTVSVCGPSECARSESTTSRTTFIGESFVSTGHCPEQGVGTASHRPQIPHRRAARPAEGLLAGVAAVVSPAPSKESR